MDFWRISDFSSDFSGSGLLLLYIPILQGAALPFMMQQTDIPRCARKKLIDDNLQVKLAMEDVEQGNNKVTTALLLIVHNVAER